MGHTVTIFNISLQQIYVFRNLEIIPNCSWILVRSPLADCLLKEVLDQQNPGGMSIVIQRAENPLRRDQKKPDQQVRISLDPQW